MWRLKKSASSSRKDLPDAEKESAELLLSALETHMKFASEGENTSLLMAPPPKELAIEEINLPESLLMGKTQLVSRTINDANNRQRSIFC